jgi:hypothetical protein
VKGIGYFLIKSIIVARFEFLTVVFAEDSGFLECDAVLFSGLFLTFKRSCVHLQHQELLAQ